MIKFSKVEWRIIANLIENRLVEIKQENDGLSMDEEKIEFFQNMAIKAWTKAERD